jgi:peptidoglycan/LPS O-acetylase OafA/YrhL
VKDKVVQDNIGVGQIQIVRLPELDFLRGVAILLVLCRHWEFHGTISAVVEPFHRIGWSGVDLFFVLSGFLVSGLLFSEIIKTSEVSPLRFLIRRGFKIYPPFYAFLALTLLSAFWGRVEGIQQVTWRNTLGEVFFLQNMFFSGSLWIHTWSLAVEEHFYFMLAGLVWFVHRMKWIHKPRKLAAFAGAILIGTYLLRLSCALLFPERRIFFFTFFRIDSLLFGVIISYFYSFNFPLLLRSTRKLRYVIPIMAVLCLSRLWVYDPSSFQIKTIGYTFAYLGYGALLISFLFLGLSEGIRRVFGKRFFQLICFIGTYSYTIYLLHLYVKGLIEVDPSLSGWGFLAFVALSITAGVVFSVAIERPSLRLRERWFPRKTPFSVISTN